MATPKPKGRDYPLSMTPEPVNRKAYPSDATSIVSKSKAPMPDQPKYTYKTTKYNQKDSTLYKQGFEEGTKKADKPSSLGSKKVVGLSDRYNEGYSEGKDVATVKKGSKGLDAYQKSFLNDWNKKKR